jgi:hypothetical protein
VLGGRDDFDANPDVSGIYGAWQGPVFVLTNHPEDAQPADGVTFLNCDVAEAVRVGCNAHADRAAALAPWLELYNTRRRHTALGVLPPVTNRLAGYIYQRPTCGPLNP